MAVKLKVNNVADAAFSGEFVFGEDRITIGRDAGNLLTLPDDRRILSKYHAEIRATGDRAEVVDLGSKNYTYLNGERLRGQEPAALQMGDVVRIGDYELQVIFVESPPASPKGAADDDRTVFAFNAFWEPAAQLRDAVRRLEQTYARELPDRRPEALHDALAEVFDTRPEPAVAEALAGVLGVAPPPAVSPVAPPAAPSPAPAMEPSMEPPSYSQAFSQGDVGRAAGPPAPAAEPLPAPRASAVAETLLGYVAGLLGIPWRFRHEFIGQTIMQSEASAVLYEGSVEALRTFLLDETVSADEAARRRELFAEAAEALRLHQVALLDGYKAGIQQGIQRFLDEVDLERIEASVAEEAKWFEKPMTRQRAYEQLQEKVAALRAEDWTATERRVFRPAFIKAYLARMTSIPR